VTVAEELSGKILPCDEENSCLNSPVHRLTIDNSLCGSCRLAKSGGGTAICWRPWDRKLKHPQLEQETREAKHEVKQAKRQKKAAKDRSKQKLARVAARAEEKTNDDIIKATRNSGRSNQDGDALHGEKVTLDTKKQTTRVHPVVDLQELDKVREDALRAGASVGALVLRNKHDRAVVVFDEGDYARLFTRVILTYARQLVKEK
jgi:hypothetical protein